MFKKILIGTDFSLASDCLIRCVGEFKGLGLERVILAHIIYVANAPGLEDRMKSEDVPEIQRQKQLLEAQGFEVTTEIHLGIPARELKALAERYEVDAIVMGSRGHGFWRSLLGSVSFKMLQISDRPVFLAPVRVVGEGESCQLSVCFNSFQNILVPVDFSTNSDRIIDYLETMLEKYKASLTLLHVIDNKYVETSLSGQEAEHYRKQVDNQLKELKQRLEKAGGQVETELAEGTPWEKIVNRTRSDRFSLVVMGRHGRGFFQEALLGSVANEVSRQTELPVLFLPLFK
ncbi:MAG TPA: universal stress protein [Geoalkalibacter subterraneus]|uniref:Universal stress protein n=1 Tax=Geoalkalibacter subterraneus TaxID=483547 RepID=A0A831L891_9BACT|nr:universal stress protein [Geoalkalibacter subterraneus]